MSSMNSLAGASGKLLRRIHRACRPSLDEPNVALNLEICDLINDKQGNLPREAAVTVVKLINSRDPQVAELALCLLDYMVKNCNYPIHLQISRKEFLNELVKKFPERPPPSYTRTQRLILGTIAEWVQTICKTSRYKEDLGYIRDMYRLLRSKGYDFPPVKSEDAAVLNPSDNLKSIQEIQKEERLAQSAKLQELVRRGRPQDLREANDLMKIMSGFKEDESLEETKQKVHHDIEKLKRKADILDDMLNNASNTGKFDSNDETVSELITALKVAQPKLQTLIQEESDDQVEVNNILALNDRINNILEKAGYLKTGEITSSSKGMNLIDFDDDDVDESNQQQPTQSSTNDAIADLLGDLGGLSFNSTNNNNNNSQAGNLSGFGAINLLASPDQGNTREQSPAPPVGGAFDLLGGFSTSQTASTPTPAPAQQQPPKLDPFQFDFLSSSNNTTAQSPPSQPQQQQLYQFAQKDPLKIEYSVISKVSNEVKLSFKFTNLSISSSINNLTFSIAVTKAFELKMSPPSASNIVVGGSPITQNVSIIAKNGDIGSSGIKLKFKCDLIVDNLGALGDTGVVTINV
ncbi:hypothetical protein CANARDRAFT_25982 [[Candida] arabinofermentans NRRL YB-2248]|uniref:VHS domain-containing protein n=1 Tax=[Candida] arabinofermentans NRRL YB-2248 TaxID=983967 RepID=A0A1E4T7N4_9ASCO|nr:hypothetical protein CANARDRAFT_25982 [[Candida] arabinofermentans NRRL YB-2248]